jgi:hypothetical protein
MEVGLDGGRVRKRSGQMEVGPDIKVGLDECWFRCKLCR